MGQKQQQHSDPGSRWALAAVGTVAAATVTTIYPSLLVPVAWTFLGVLALGVLLSRAFGGSQGGLSGEAALQLVRQRRSVYPKDFTGGTRGAVQIYAEGMLQAA